MTKKYAGPSESGRMSGRALVLSAILIGICSFGRTTSYLPRTTMQSNLLIVDDRVCIQHWSGTLVALDLTSGEVVQQRHDFNLRGDLLEFRGNIFAFGKEDWETWLNPRALIDPQDLASIWEIDTRGGAWGTNHLLYQGIFYYTETLGTGLDIEDHRAQLVSRDLESGRIRWVVPVPGSSYIKSWGTKYMVVANEQFGVLILVDLQSGAVEKSSDPDEDRHRYRLDYGVEVDLRLGNRERESQSGRDESESGVGNNEAQLVGGRVGRTSGPYYRFHSSYFLDALSTDNDYRLDEGILRLEEVQSPEISQQRSNSGHVTIVTYTDPERAWRGFFPGRNAHNEYEFYAFNDDVLVLATQHGEVLCLDKATGATRWIFSSPSREDVKYASTEIVPKEMGILNRIRRTFGYEERPRTKSSAEATELLAPVRKYQFHDFNRTERSERVIDHAKLRQRLLKVKDFVVLPADAGLDWPSLQLYVDAKRPNSARVTIDPSTIDHKFLVLQPDP